MTTDRSTSMRDDPRPDGRTHYEAVLDVRYGMRFNVLCERAYRRVDMLLTAVTVIGGSAAAVAWVNRSPEWAAASGLVLAVLSVLQVVAAPGRAAVEHRMAALEYARLDARAQGLALEQLDAELRLLQAQSPSGVALLAVPAFNANVRSAGREECVRALSWRERVASALA